MFLGKGGEGVHVGALAVEVNREDGGEPEARRQGFGEGFGDGLGGEVQGVGIDVGEDGKGSGPEDGRGGGEEAEGRRDDCVTGADAARGEREPKSVGAAGATDSGGNMARGGGCLLKARGGRAEDELLVSADIFNGGHDLVANDGELTAEVKHGYRGVGWCGGHLGYGSAWGQRKAPAPLCFGYQRL